MRDGYAPGECRREESSRCFGERGYKNSPKISSTAAPERPAQGRVTKAHERQPKGAVGVTTYEYDKSRTQTLTTRQDGRNTTWKLSASSFGTLFLRESRLPTRPQSKHHEQVQPSRSQKDARGNLRRNPQADIPFSRGRVCFYDGQAGIEAVVCLSILRRDSRHEPILKINGHRRNNFTAAAGNQFRGGWFAVRHPGAQAGQHPSEMGGWRWHSLFPKTSRSRFN